MKTTNQPFRNRFMILPIAFVAICVFQRLSWMGNIQVGISINYEISNSPTSPELKPEETISNITTSTLAFESAKASTDSQTIPTNPPTSNTPTQNLRKNKSTNKPKKKSTVRDRAIALQGKNSPPARKEPKHELSLGWTQQKDPKTGDVYYYHAESDEVSWEKPTSEALGSDEPLEEIEIQPKPKEPTNKRKNKSISIRDSAAALQHEKKSIPLGNDELHAWRKRRYDNTTIYNGWFVNGNGTDALSTPADKEGPILDFAIIGFPKCGTTGLMRTLATVTTMPDDADICAPIDNVAYYAYHNWPKQFQTTNQTKVLKGTKCPYYIEGPDLDHIGRKLPKTRLITGIRHPVQWHQSFLNMQYYYNGKEYDGPLDYMKTGMLRYSQDHHGCTGRRKTCAARSRFYLSLARLGKTPLSDQEKDLMTSEMHQARKRQNRERGQKGLNFGKFSPLLPPNKFNQGVPNPVFLFDSSQGKEEYFYEELAKFVQIDRNELPPVEDVYRTGNGLNKKTNVNDHIIDLCLPQYDHIRQEILPIAYTLSRWLMEYLLPAAQTRSDVVIPNVTDFANKVKSYELDHCGTLVRNETDGEYYPIANRTNSSAILPQ